ncbi:histidine kinase [Spirosoma sp. BT702]|uniref:Histidine kinase n=1 Tax=Spirosoma profusum TaxID=2771354 RepID=A0A926Y2Q3_9BACT|nr:histidine kinase [Spirosoma profusum]MBD2702723.1 histidine kinase [Spirosoma profusum]
MKNVLICLLLFIHTHLLLAQTDDRVIKHDSLIRELAKAKSDTDRVLIYAQLTEVYTWLHKKAAIDYGQRGFALAKRIHFDRGTILCGHRLGFCLVEWDYYKAIPILMETKQLCEKRNDHLGRLISISFLGYAYSKFDFKKAQYYYMLGRELQARENLPKGPKPIEEILGDFYLEWGVLDSALFYMQKNEQIALKEKRVILNLDLRFGRLYYEKKQPDLAMRYFRRAVAVSRGKPNGQTYEGIARIFRDRNQLDSARFYAKKSLAIQLEREETIYIIKTASLLFDLYKASNPAEALHYHLLLSAAKDSLNNQQRVRAVEKAAYEDREREAATQRRLEAAALAYQNQLRLYALLGALAVVLLVTFFLYRNNRQSRQLEAQNIRQLESEFEQKLADTEMTTLRAQMNPHFIFNCLNSIKLYTLQNKADKASDYLTKFARLIRLVLENSRSERVTLQNELEALQLYIELEAMRFKQKVQFDIRVSPEIDQQYVQIPPLLLQPYVENAIWHGLMHKPEGGSVQVDVRQSTDRLLHIEITDDGIGRERARTLKSKSAGMHKSFGMQVTADRIRMINQLYNIQTQAQVFDLVAPDGEPLGTKVVLDIPI